MFFSELLTAVEPFLSKSSSTPTAMLEVGEPSGSKGISFTEAVPPSGNPLIEIRPAGGVNLANYASYVGQQISSPNDISYVGASLSNREASASTSSSYASSKEGLRALVDSFRNGEGSGRS